MVLPNKLGPPTEFQKKKKRKSEKILLNHAETNPI